jgi:hypothetical protein
MLIGRRGCVIGASLRSTSWRARKCLIRSRCHNPRDERGGDPPRRSGTDGGGLLVVGVAAGALVVAAGPGQSNVHDCCRASLPMQLRLSALEGALLMAWDVTIVRCAPSGRTACDLRTRLPHGPGAVRVLIYRLCHSRERVQLTAAIHLDGAAAT